VSKPVLPALAVAASVLAGLVPVSDSRHLWISCKGTGSPTVVFESGLGVYSGTWLAVQKTVAAKTRACIYDRAGLGRSDPAPPGRTSADMVVDLETLLTKASVAPPYVLVGASVGGLNAQLFAAEHPDDVAGLVLVDSLHPDFDRRIEALLPKKLKLRRRDELGLNQEHVLFAQILASEREVAAAPALPAIPLVVIRHGKPFSTDPGWPSAKVEALWRSLQADLAARVSPPARVVLAARSGHRIAEQQPALVAAEILRVVAAGR
jgi:pimeloyl-ACP methyl ester carboxylesterase